MAHCYKFSLVRVDASAPRDERLNVGIAVLGDGRLDVRMPRSLSKLSALSHALGEADVRDAAENFSRLDKLFSDEDPSDTARLERLREMSPFEFSPLGQFYAQTLEAYEAELARLMRAFVEPEPAPPRVARNKVSHLTTALKKAFRAERVLAAKGEDLNAHRVVTNLELATGLIADFVLKNGAMHVIETVDASNEASSPIRAVKDIALSALTIEQAKISFGDQTRGRLVYNATSETEALATSALQAAEHQGIELVNWASGDDQRKLITTISALASPIPTKSPAKAPINASTQHRFEIN